MPFEYSDIFLEKNKIFWFGKTQIYIKMQDEKGYNTIAN